MSHTAPGKATVDGVWLDVNLQHQVVTNLSTGDVVSVGVADSHAARGRGTGVGDGPGCCQHGHIEAYVDGLNACVVDTADSVSL